MDLCLVQSFETIKNMPNAAKNKRKTAAWVIVLTSTNRYVLGVLTIQHAFRKVKSKYPLLVLHTSEVSSQALSLLSQAGCLLQGIELIRPATQTTYFTERFTETWTKFAAWNQSSYDRLVLMDADMLPLRNMDELMEISLPGTDWIAASHACTCNPLKIKAYPSSWVPSNCAYTGCGNEAADKAPDKQRRDYFNSGLVVLSPSKSVFQDIIATLHGTKNLSEYPFPDQDLLNKVFAKKWRALPYTYNALKTLPTCHASMWNLAKVKNVHYILEKPWDSKNDQCTSAPLDQCWWDTYQQVSAGLDLSCIS